MKTWWLSWYHRTELLGEFELHSPWWVSGWRESDDAATIVAAVKADSEIAAKNKIDRAYDSPPGQLEWRFCEEKAADYMPFSERFPRADWMVWQ